MTKGTKPQEFYVDEAGRHPVFAISDLLVADSIKDTHIDWGTGAGQVGAADVPIADAGSRYTGTEVETALQELAGSGRTTETVKANADAIALRALASRQIIAGVGLSGGGDLTADRTLTLAIPKYATGWINRSDWTNVHLGSDPTLNVDSNITHNLDAPLPNLLVKLFCSTDGTDANSFEAHCILEWNATTQWVYGFTITQVNNNNLLIQTGTHGLLMHNADGTINVIDTENWYYKIKVFFVG